MKIVEPQVELWKQEPTLEGAWHQIAKATRVCYQSKPREGESDEAFVNRVIIKPATRKDGSIDFDKCHGAMLEHGTIYLTIPINHIVSITNYVYNKYSKVIWDRRPVEIYAYITTNMRVILEHKWQDDLQFMCAPTNHVKRTTFSVITDIGVTRELNRHRTFSIAEQSTRYCNFNKNKFGEELTFIRPVWLSQDDINFKDDKDIMEYLSVIQEIEDTYKYLIINNWRPEQARQVLPLGLKTQAVYTAFSDDWKHFLKLRADNASGKVHPNMKIIADKIKELFNNK